MSRKSFQTKNVLTLSGAHMLHDIYSSFLAPLRPLLIEKFQMTLLLSSLLDVFQRLPNLLNPIVGIIADKAPARYFVIISPAITAITMSLLGAAPHYSMLVILLLVMGISSALFHVPSPVMIKKLAGNRTGKGMSFYMLGGELARTIGPLIITGAVSLWGLEGTWKLIPFGILASFILYLRLKNIKISSDLKPKGGEGNLKNTFKTHKHVFLVLTGVIFFRAIVKSGLTGFLPTYFYSEIGESLWFSNVSLAALQIAGAAGTYLSGTLSDKLGRKSMLLISAIGLPLVMWLFLMVKSIYTLPVLLLLGLFVFAPGPVILAFVQDIKTQRPALLNGIYMTINFLSGSMSVLLVGWLGDMLSLKTTYMITATAAILSIPFVFLLKPTHTDKINKNSDNLKK